MYYHVQLQARFSNVSFSIEAPKCCCNTRNCGAPYRRDVVLLPSPKVSFISSTSNPFVKHCLKLRQSSSYRQSQGSAIVVGITPIKEISQLQPLQGGEHFVLECLLLLEGAEAPNGLVDSIGHIINVSSNVMKKLSGVQSIDSITAIAIMRIPNSFYKLHDNEGLEACENWLSCAHRILTLDGIQDPGNLGTLLRSAMAFKWDGIFLLPGCCDPFNEKALRAARGATFQLPIVSGTSTHLEELRNRFQMKMLAGHPNNKEERNWHILSRQYADTLADKSICLILGSEGNGLSESSSSMCELVSIPMAGNFESLNVSVAGGIFLFMLQSEHREQISS